MTPQQLLASDAQLNDGAMVTELDISHLVIEDDTPVDNFQSEEQQRLLVEPLYSAKALPSPFLAAANVGLFYKLHGDPIVPDTLLSLGVQRPDDYSERRNRSYFVWEFGKVPEVCVEIVSNKEGNELVLSRKAQQEGKTESKKNIYAHIRVPYYVVFDPLRQIQGEREMNGALLRVWSMAAAEYEELTPDEGIVALGQWVWLKGVGVGLALWEGEFEEDVRRLWLRWCDQEGRVIPTGAERAEQAEQRVEQAEQRVEQAEQRVEQAEQRAETERQRAEQSEEKAQRLAERLRELGMNPDEV